MLLTYSGRSAISAHRIALEDPDIRAVRSDTGHVNWGRARANTLLNPDISNATNKYKMRQLFAIHNVPTPRLLSWQEANQLVYQGIPVLGRPSFHMKGRGFWKCTSIRDIQYALRGTRTKAPATHFMEWIDAPREYRVHIFKGKSIRISEKAHTAFHEYTTVKPSHNIKHVRRAAKQAVASLGLDFGAVDVLADDDNCWVTEVNAAPGLGGSMPKLYAGVFKAYVKENYGQ